MKQKYLKKNHLKCKHCILDDFFTKFLLYKNSEHENCYIILFNYALLKPFPYTSLTLLIIIKDFGSI